MPTKSNSRGYDTVSRLNHWVVALVMIGMLAFGLYLENAGLSKEARGELMGIHKAIGAVFLVLAIGRVGYRLYQGFPQPVAIMPKWQDLASKAVHWSLLAGVLIMPISGLMMSLFSGRSVDVFGLVTISAFEKNETLGGIGHVAHGIGANILLAAIAVHVVAALKHHFIDKDLTLSRMLGNSKAEEGTRNV